MKKIIIIMTVILSLSSFYSCNYLDVVPDNIATLDHAFSNRLEAERFLFTCYSYMPNQTNVDANVALCGADEMWTNRRKECDGLRIAQGLQQINDPLINYWEGRSGANVNLYNGIRDCNIFLEVLEDRNRIPDLRETERKRWISEVKFLKAYYHFYLFRMYGPIVIVDKNLPIDASPEEVRLKRQSVDSVVNYINNLYNECLIYELPKKIQNTQDELGRITHPIVLSMKARLWMYAASPLFNGNEDYIDYEDKDGMRLFSQGFEQSKWDSARVACKFALESAEAAGAKKYVFPNPKSIETPETILEMTIRNGFAEDEWEKNTEVIWGLSGRGTFDLQRNAMARIDPNDPRNNNAAWDRLNPTIQITDFYYTKNGVPINEDLTWNKGRALNDVVRIDSTYKYYLKSDYDVIARHIEREPRFYANLGFDGSIWYMENSVDPYSFAITARADGQQTALGANDFSATGYWPKKLVNYKFVFRGEGQFLCFNYPWPEMRLSDLWLLYAEALCQNGELDEAIRYIDNVRLKSGLKGVKESWDNHSINSKKYTNKDGLMEIIKQERTIELMFEGSRYWDLRRWKELDKLSQVIQGWDVDQILPATYYRPKYLYNQGFSPRDYLAPIREYALIVNPKLVQNPGW